MSDVSVFKLIRNWKILEASYVDLVSIFINEIKGYILFSNFEKLLALYDCFSYFLFIKFDLRISNSCARAISRIITL